MKPFNLKKAEAGQPVCTRDGRNVVIIDYNYKAGARALYETLLIAKIIHTTETEEIATYYQDGRYNHSYDSAKDLFMVGEKHEGWGWLTRDNNIVSMFAQIYETEEEALSHKPDRGESFLAKVEWEGEI